MCEIKIDLLQNFELKIPTGKQDKWKIDDMYYKADSSYCEGLAETVVSDMLEHSNMKSFFRYSPIMITYNGKTVPGCKSPNGLKSGEELITAYSLFDAYNSPFYSRIDNPFDYGSPKEYLTEFVSEIEQITGIKHFGEYITAIVELDAITLNNDRHMNNIAVIRRYETDTFELAPVFDNGHAFLLCCSLKGGIGKAFAQEAMPFSRDFQTQAKIARELYGRQLKIMYGKKEFKNTLQQFEDVYSKQTLKYIRYMFAHQMDENRDTFYSEEREIWKENVKKKLGQNGLSAYMEDRGFDTFLSFGNGLDYNIRPSGFVEPVQAANLSFYEIAEKFGQDSFEQYRLVSQVTNELSRIPFGKEL